MTAAAGEPVVASRPRRDLRLIFQEGVAWSAMVGLGETYFAAFVLALGMGAVPAGLISTVPLLAGGVLQLVTPWGVTRLRSRRRWVAACAFVQAAAFLPFIGAAAMGRISVLALFAAASLYWGAGLAAGPAWNVWVGQLVPRMVRTRYWARRTWAIQLGSLLALLAGGAILELASKLGAPLLGFAVIFLLAGGARYLSYRRVSRQSESRPPLTGERLVVGRDLLGRFRHAAGGKLLGYMIVLTASVAIASPYFTPYMLQEIGFSYTAYMFLIGASFAAKIAVLTGLGGLARRVGAMALLRVGGLGIMAIPLFWMVSRSFSYLLVLQVASGVLWAFYEFASFLLLFDTIREEERTSLLTTYNLVNSMATVGGSLLGAALFGALGHGLLGYRALFAVSWLARLGAVVLLVRVAGLKFPVMGLLFRTLALRPSAGSIDWPLLAAVRGRRRR